MTDPILENLHLFYNNDSRKDRPYMFGYGRASTDGQVLSPKAQEDQCRKWFADSMASGRFPEATQWAGWYCDPNESTRKKWIHRPAGEALWRFLRPGDHIVISRMDRAMRSGKEVCDAIEKLQSIGVTLHILDFPVDLATPHGVFFAQMLGAWGELERKMIATRTKETLAWKKRQGLPWGGHSPIGWKKTGIGRESRFVAYPEERQQALYIKTLKEEHGLSFCKIYYHLLRCLRRVDGREWSKGAIERAYNAAKDGFPIPGCENGRDKIGRTN